MPNLLASLPRFLIRKVGTAGDQQGRIGLACKGARDSDGVGEVGELFLLPLLGLGTGAALYNGKGEQGKDPKHSHWISLPSYCSLLCCLGSSLDWILAMKLEQMG